MPFQVRKNRNQDTYKVTNKITGKIYAKATRKPLELIKAVEAGKLKKIKKNYNL